MNGFSRYLLSTLLLLLAGIASAEIETVTWLHTDHLGSPLMARDAQGNTMWQEDYSPWGERLAAPPANSADIGYTGHYEEADIGLTYAQARWYDPAVGRFLSADAVGFGAGGARHFNRYTYAYNSPYIYNDPDGKAANYMLRASWEVGSLGGRYVAAPLINWTINAAVRGKATYTLGTYLYDVVHNETAGEAGGGDVNSPEAGRESENTGEHDDERRALNGLLKDLTNGGRKPLSGEDADAALDIARELGIEGVRDDRGKDHWEGGEHIHVPGSGIKHIPVGD